MGHFHAGHQGRLGVPRRDPGDEVLALASLVELLDAEREIGELAVVDLGQDVVGMQIPQRDEDVDHLRMELALVERLVAQPQQA